jgi:hypothetical protein
MTHTNLDFEQIFSRNTEPGLSADFIKKLVDLSKYNEIHILEPTSSQHQEVLGSPLFKNFWTLVQFQELGDVEFFSNRPKLLICTNNIAPWPTERIRKVTKKSQTCFDCLVFLNWPSQCGFEHSGTGVLNDKEVLSGICNQVYSFSKRCKTFLSNGTTSDQTLRCLARQDGRAVIIPFSLRTTERVKKALLWIASGLYSLKKLKTDLEYNRTAAQWKATYMDSFSKQELTLIEGFTATSKYIHGSLQVGENNLFFINPLFQHKLHKHRKLIQKTWHDYGSWEDCVIAQTHKSTRLFGETARNYDHIINTLNGIVVQAICFDTVEFVQNWVEHYKLLGADSFLIYFNEFRIPKTLVSFANKNEDVYLIPWPGNHTKMNLAGKPEYHTFQPASIQHAHALCSLSNAIGMLSIDIDEYIIGPNLKETMKLTPHNSITFQNLWSQRSDASEGHWIGQSVKCDDQFTWNHIARRKALWKLPANGKFGLHGEYKNELRSREHVMLHFGDMKSERVRKNTFNRGGAPKQTSYGVDFYAIDKHPNLELRAIFEKWNQS